jgi:hypothetical protein
LDGERDLNRLFRLFLERELDRELDLDRDPELRFSGLFAIT